MKKYILAAIIGLSSISASAPAVFAGTISAAHLAATVGTYQMKWGNGKTGTFTVHSIDGKTAKVTYSYGGKSKTKDLRVKNNVIKGGGWFPTLKFDGAGGGSAGHSGSSATLSKD